MSENLVVFEDVSFKWVDKSILSHVSLSIPKGKITAIMGPSGTGKTTLLRLIGRELRPNGGKIWLNDQNINKLSENDCYRIRRRMGILFQSAALFTNTTVYENIAFPYREHTQLKEDMIADLVSLKLEAVGLRGAKDLMPSQLSGGMARRVALARALALDPELMMYDEPFVGQDPISVGVLLKLIRELNHILDMTTIIVSHDVKETLAIADYVYILSSGAIVGHGKPEAMLQSHEPHIEQFMNGLPDGVFPFHYPAKTIQEELFSC